MRLHVPTRRPSPPTRLSRPSRPSRGVSLVEVAVALIVITISVVVMFSVFTAAQVSMVNTVREQKINQVLRNEAERVMSMTYTNVTNQTVPVMVDGERYDVTLAVTIVPLTGNAAPVVKRVSITAVHTPSGETGIITVVKAP
ncbi:MAG: hypothetical protein AB7S36_06415 [Planctomycetota bacterium]